VFRSIEDFGIKPEVSGERMVENHEPGFPKERGGHALVERFGEPEIGVIQPPACGLGIGRGGGGVDAHRGRGG
jgi:hypothetical protein